MSGTTNDRPTTHIDYREAFVLDMELHAHSFSQCKQCLLAGLRGKPDDSCDKVKHMREAIKRAYEALPKYYKDRYTAALETTFNGNAQIIKDLGGR